jgi:hypothetical protein
MLQVSGGIFIHTETTKVHVAKSLLSGISAGFEESRADSRPGETGPVCGVESGASILTPFSSPNRTSQMRAKVRAYP